MSKEVNKADDLECIYCGTDKDLQELKGKSICTTCLSDIKEMK